MENDRLQKSFAQSYRWGLAGFVGAGVSALKDVSVYGVTGMALALLFFIGIITFATFIEYYFIQEWDPES